VVVVVLVVRVAVVVVVAEQMLQVVSQYPGFEHAAQNTVLQLRVRFPQLDVLSGNWKQSAPEATTKKPKSDKQNMMCPSDLCIVG